GTNEAPETLGVRSTAADRHHDDGQPAFGGCQARPSGRGQVGGDDGDGAVGGAHRAPPLRSRLIAGRCVTPRASPIWAQVTPAARASATAISTASSSTERSTPRS